VKDLLYYVAMASLIIAATLVSVTALVGLRLLRESRQRARLAKVIRLDDDGERARR